MIIALIKSFEHVNEIYSNSLTTHLQPLTNNNLYGTCSVRILGCVLQENL